MHEPIHVKLTSRHIAFIVGLVTGFLFWGVRIAFGSTGEIGVLPVDHVVAATQSAARAFIGTVPTEDSAVASEVVATIPAPAPSPLEGTKPSILDLSTHKYTVALQVGHMRNQNPPAELAFIKRNTGAVGGNTNEPAVAYTIAMETKRRLEQHGVKVEILPAVVTPGYQADAFVSIHTDGSEKNWVSGYKTAASAYDQSGSARLLSALIDQEYGKATGMNKDDKITENMTHYYSFAHGRISHSISPYTPGVLLETGFLTSEKDRETIVKQPEKSAEGLAKGIIAYLKTQN